MIELIKYLIKVILIEENSKIKWRENIEKINKKDNK